MLRNNSVVCKKTLKDSGSYRFLPGKRYSVVFIGENTASVVDESGYKKHFYLKDTEDNKLKTEYPELFESSTVNKPIEDYFNDFEWIYDNLGASLD